MSFMKVAMCGSMGVGKTSLLAKMVEGVFFPFSESTIGAGFHSVRLDNTRTIEVWDTSGQERYRALVNMYFRNATVVMIVYDVNDCRSFADVTDYWLRVACEHVDASHIYLVGNKTDRPSHARRVPYDDAALLVAHRNLCGFVELSAKTNSASDIASVFNTIYRTFEHEIQDRGGRECIQMDHHPTLPVKSHRGCC